MIALHISVKLIYCLCVNDISISISARDAFLSFSVLQREMWALQIAQAHS